jgi:hypothetical protein
MTTPLTFDETTAALRPYYNAETDTVDIGALHRALGNDQPGYSNEAHIALSLWLTGEAASYNAQPAQRTPRRVAFVSALTGLVSLLFAAFAR